jgi:hypothetical protein
MADANPSPSRWKLLGERLLYALWWTSRIVKWLTVSLITVVALIFVSNLLLFPSYRRIPSRALAPDSVSCTDARSPDWDALAATNNDEWAAIDQKKISARKLACSIQHHAIPAANLAPEKNGEAQKSLSYARFH